MSSRIPLLVAVVGALLLGNATTGGTHASWVGQRQLATHSVGSGSMSFTATTPAGIAVNRVLSDTANTFFVVRDTSGGKNLTQRITVTVASTPAGISATVGTSCGSGGGSMFMDTTPGSGDRTLCVRVTSSATAVSGNVTLSLSGAQRPTGWTTPTTTRSFPVTVTTAAPVAPILTGCEISKANGDRFATLNWASVPGVTYTVQIRNTNTTVAALNGVAFEQGSLSNEVDLVVTAAQNGMSTTSTAYFDIKFPNATCDVVTP